MPFCEEPYVLGVIKELHQEYKKSPTLRNKFGWVDNEEYSKNRQACFKISKDQAADINIAFYIIRDTARDEKLTTGKVDITALSYAHTLEIPIVTDDKDLLKLAKLFEIKTYKSLELLKLLFDCGHIDIEKVRAIASYWIYLKDTPASYKKDYKMLFNEAPPL
jgi:hypothetical protein